MKIREIKCKSILTKTRLPACDYVINPYVGCSFGCVYCYSRFMKRFTGHREPWRQFVDIKINAPEILEKQIKHSKKGMVFMSSTTDPYMGIEAKHKLTRKILEILSKHQFPVSVLTKSPLVLRDIDLFKKFKDITVGLTITTLDNAASKNFEPNTIPSTSRIKILKKLHDNKIKTYAHVGPILPFFTDPPKIFSMLNKTVDTMWLESLNTTGANWAGVEKVLKNKYPQLLPKYREIFFTKQKIQYVNELRKEISNLSKQHKIKTYFFVHGR
jgi:DNA repair photolyase